MNRHRNDKPYLLMPVGDAAENVMVPDIKRKEKEEVIVRYS